MQHTYARLARPIVSILLLMVLVVASADALGGDPFRVGAKPPVGGYISSGGEPIEPSFLGVSMLDELNGLAGQIEARGFVKLRRGIVDTPIEPDLLSDATRVAYLHMYRQDVERVVEIHALARDEYEGLYALRGEGGAVWALKGQSLAGVGVVLVDGGGDELEGGQGKQAGGKQALRFVLGEPHVASTITLDRRTVRARFKQNYPELTRDPSDEVYRVRLPRDYNAEFPAGVVVWISPMDDGRIPTIFEPILDELGMIAIGVDGNGNKRSLTDRLQNHLDSIETLGSRYRIDRERVYLTGASGGGRCSGILLCGFPDVFAGAVPMIGLDTYHNAPTGEPNSHWAARLGRPAGRWMKLLKKRRIGGITGSADFNEPEMSIRKGLLERDGIEMRLDVIEGMAHTMPDAKAFSKSLKWVDEPRRDAMVEAFKEAKALMQAYREANGDAQALSPAMRQRLIEIIELAPWTEPAWEACGVLGYAKE
jgi:hypothetical protein